MPFPDGLGTEPRHDAPRACPLCHSSNTLTKESTNTSFFSQTYTRGTMDSGLQDLTLLWDPHAAPNTQNKELSPSWFAVLLQIRSTAHHF